MSKAHTLLGRENWHDVNLRALIERILQPFGLNDPRVSNEAVGHIDIAWKVEPNPKGKRMRLRWQESGGPPVALPNRNGFGSRLMKGGLAQDLNGEVRLDYDAAGVVCEIVMPIFAERMEEA